jgi:hypothetical protein
VLITSLELPSLQNTSPPASCANQVRALRLLPTGPTGRDVDDREAATGLGGMLPGHSAEGRSRISATCSSESLASGLRSP